MIYNILASGMEKVMAPHSSTLAWKIPWTEEPGGPQSMRSLRVGHDWATSLSCIGEGHGNLLQCSCLENPRDGGASWAAIYGVAQSRTRLKRLSSSSSRGCREWWPRLTPVLNAALFTASSFPGLVQTLMATVAQWGRFKDLSSVWDLEQCPVM